MFNILIIEDDDLVQNMISSVLRKNGYQVSSASNGVEGVEKVRSGNPDLAITDILMPDKEGIQTIVEIKQMRPDIKIIAMSSGGQAKNMSFLNMAKKVGAEYVLQKPFKPSELINIINKLLNAKGGS